MTDSQHLAWIVGRLINVHGENPSVDYMIRLQEIVKRLNLPPKAEPKEWPQVGDTVIWGNGADNFKLLVVHKGGAWKPMLTIDTEIIPVSELKKSKTEAEILRDEIFQSSGVRARDGGHQIANDVADFLLSKYNITKKA